MNLMVILFHNRNVFDLITIDKGHQIEFLKYTINWLLSPTTQFILVDVSSFILGYFNYHIKFEVESLLFVPCCLNIF